MRIESVTLRGMLRFSDAATLSLQDVGPGLVALVGSNGEGKTGTLEAAVACLYRVFPSRGDKELVDYATGPDSFIETVFALDGQGLFRARLNLDGPHRKADAVLARINADGSTTVLTDGKVTSYDAAIAQLLPPLPALLASVFSAQNRAGSFVTLDKKGRKQLFASLLGLDAYDAMADRAKVAAGLVQQTIDRLSARREALSADAGDDVIDRLEADAQRLQVESGTVETRRVELQRDLAAIEAQLAELQEAAAAHAVARTRLDRVELDLQSGTGERDQARAALTRLAVDAESERRTLDTISTDVVGAVSRQQADMTDLLGALTAIDDELRRELADIETRITNNRRLLENADVIRAADVRVAEIDAAVAIARQAEQGLSEQIDACIKRDQVLQRTASEIVTHEHALARARKDVALLETVPCAGAGEYAVCQFLTSAAAARAEVPRLEAACASRAATDVEAATVQQEYLRLRGERATLHKGITEQQAARTEAQRLAARLPDVKAAEDKITGYHTRATELQTDAERRRAEARVREAQRQRDLTSRLDDNRTHYDAQCLALDRRTTARRDELTATIESLAERLTVLAFEQDELRAQVAGTRDASERAAAQTALLTLRRQEWDDTRDVLARVTAQREDLDRRREAVAARRRELAGLTAQVTGHTADLLEWQLLAKALGRDGLQTLEIDAAGPTVSAFCNDLLQTCFGSRFSVDLVTQEAKATKGKDGNAFKEVFELRVFDRERGGDARDLADLSGGEQVLVDEALKSAISLLVNTRNAHPIRTCWRDETTGALDGENATRYVEMLRRVQQLGGFQHVLFVSHNPDAALLADVQVRIGGGRIAVVTPPYSEAA